MRYAKPKVVAQAHLLDAIQTALHKLTFISDNYWLSMRQTTNAYEADE